VLIIENADAGQIKNRKKSQAWRKPVRGTAFIIPADLGLSADTRVCLASCFHGSNSFNIALGQPISQRNTTRQTKEFPGRRRRILARQPPIWNGPSVGLASPNP
jgi:hypothetical protein